MNAPATPEGPSSESSGALTLDDVLDLRAYERARPAYRRAVMEHKRHRRILLGELMSVVFESWDTVRFQVHEMVRAERMLSDQAIEEELEIYNRLLPQRGELSATLFIELTTEEQLRRWLPALVGIERALAIELEVAQGEPVVVGSIPEATHAEALTREAVTPAVHYLRFPFPPEALEALAAGPAALVARHPAYQARTELAEPTREALVGDLRGETRLLPLA